MGWTSIELPKGERVSNLDVLKQNSSMYNGHKWGSGPFEFEMEGLRGGTGAVHGIIKETEKATGRFVRIALIVLMERKDGHIAWKEIDETQGPNHLGYPEVLFNRLSPLDEIAALTQTNITNAAQWRKQLEEVYKARKVAKGLKRGDIIELAHPVSFSIDNESVEVQRFRIEAWGKRRSLMALPLRGAEFPCRLNRYTWQNTPYQVIV
jgi:hypothetical protein